MGARNVNVPSSSWVRRVPTPRRWTRRLATLVAVAFVGGVGLTAATMTSASAASLDRPPVLTIDASPANATFDATLAGTLHLDVSRSPLGVYPCT